MAENGYRMLVFHCLSVTHAPNCSKPPFSVWS